MGTALQSTTDRDDSAALKRIIRAASKDPKRSRQLRNALSKAINKVIFKGSEIAPVRNTVTAAIAVQVEKDVLRKFKATSGSSSKRKSTTSTKRRRND